MPPLIALTACLVFIFILIRYDINRNNKCSVALWVPIIWLLIIGSRPVDLWINPYSKEFDVNTAGNLINQIVDVILITAGILILIRRKTSIQNVLLNNKSVFLFFLFCGISILWSDYPFISLKRYFKAIGNIIVIMVIFTESDPIEAINTVMRRCAYVIVPLSICLIKYFPFFGRWYNPWTGDLMIVGVTTDKNALGRVCMIFCLLYSWNFTYELRNKNYFRNFKEILIQFTIFVMMLWLLYSSQSATSLLCYIIGFTMIIMLKIPVFRYRVKNIGIYIIVSLLFIYALDYIFNIREIVITGLGRNTTFTERDVIWKTLLNMGTNPWIGTGFESFWLGTRVSHIVFVLGYNPTESHNGYLEIYLNLGIVGLVLITSIFISCYMNIRRTFSDNYNFAVIGLVLLIVFLLYNITEAAIRGTYIFWSILLIISIDYRSIVKNGNI
jgi:O-antigen ligase